jgi:hypothetical protein
MKANGNGIPERCVENLLRITRGEVPYDRIKGLDAAAADAPAAQIAPAVEADAAWMVATYEPRVQVNGANLESTQAQHGHFVVSVQISRKGGTL